MTSKNLFFKRFKQDVEQRIWLPVILFIITFLFQEIALVSEFEWLRSRDDFWNRAQDYLVNNFFVPTSPLSIITVTAAFFCALTGFSFVHSSKKLDLYHSLPVKREKIFIHQYIYGFLYYLVPILLHLLICLGIVTANGAFCGKVLASAFGMLIFQILLFFANYSVSVLAVCLTGSTIISALGTAIFMAYTLGLEVISVQLMSDFFYTYHSFGGSKSQLFPAWSPLHLLYNCLSDIRYEDGLYFLTGVGIGYLFKFLLMAVVYCGIALVVYKKRASEASNRTLAFRISEPVIKAMLVIPGTFLIGYLFSTLTSYGNERIWFYFGMAFGFVILCLALEIIFRKEVKALFRHPLQILFNGVCVTLIMLVLQFDLLGYDTYVPDEDKVESYALHLDCINRSHGRYGYSIEEILREMEMTENESVKELFRYAAEITRPVQHEHKMDQNAVYNSLWAKYQLKNGKEVYRRYVIDIANEQVQYLLGNIYDDMDFKKGIYPVLDEKESPNYIGLTLEYAFGEETVFLQKDHMKQFLEVYRKELSKLTVPEMINHYPVARLGFVVPYTDVDTTNKEMTTAEIWVADAEWNEVQAVYGIEDYWIESNYIIYPTFTETLALLESYGVEDKNSLPKEKLTKIKIADHSYESNDHDGLLTKLVELEYLPEDLNEDQLAQLFTSFVSSYIIGDFYNLKTEDVAEDIYAEIFYYNDRDYENTQRMSFKKDMIPGFLEDALLEKAIEIGAVSQ